MINLKKFTPNDYVYIFIKSRNPCGWLTYFGYAKIDTIINNETINNLIDYGCDLYVKSLIELNEEEIESIDLVYKE